MRYNVNYLEMQERSLNESNVEDMRITQLREIGADDSIIEEWEEAERKGISFSEFLKDLVNDFKSGRRTSNNQGSQGVNFDHGLGNEE